MGTANLYAASEHAFEGHYDALIQILGGSAVGIIRNADLSFTTRRAAEDGMTALRAHDTINHSVGVLIHTLRLDRTMAEQRLHDAARRAGLTSAQFAAAIIGLYS